MPEPALARQQGGGSVLGNRQEASRRALRASRALFPALYGLAADTEEVREYCLAGMQAFPDAANFRGLERRGRGWNFRHSQINLLPALIGQSVGQGLPHIVVDFHLDLLCHLRRLPAIL